MPGLDTPMSFKHPIINLPDQADIDVVCLERA
jgi:hypothetical protein